MRLFKKIFMVLLICLNISVIVAHANEMPKKYVYQTLDLIEGQWYDVNNNLVLNISNRKINDCLVIAGFDFVGGRSFAKGTFRIAERQGYRDIVIEWNIRGTESDYLVFNNSISLHKGNKGVQYYESVGGVYLGMSKNQLISKYGTPTYYLNNKGTNKLCGVNESSWFYLNDGWIVTFNGEAVDRIIILNGGTRRFDRTGLNCMNSIDSFAAAYGSSKSKIMSIGHGEYLCFFDYPNSIMLSPYFS